MPGQPAEDVGTLDIARLADGYPCLTTSGGVYLAQACAVCLEEREHVPGQCRLATRGHFEASYRLTWAGIDDQVRRQWNDEPEATEQGAVGVAILLIATLTEFQIVQRSRKGTGFDCWLGRKDDPLFQSAARLEVSGIRVGNSRVVEGRVKQKCDQTKRSDGALPAFVVVVEFGAPVAVVVKR
jgi:hypothetical protein